MIKYTIVAVILATGLIVYYYYHRESETVKRVTFAPDVVNYERNDVNNYSARYNVTFKREWNNQQSESTVAVVDSILDTACRNAKEIVLRNSVYIPVDKKPIKLEHGISFRLIDNQDESITFKLESNNLPVNRILAWVENLVEQYKVRSHNKLGNRRYFFDECHGGKNKQRLEFTMTRFHTNKSMNTVYGKGSEAIRKNLDLFLNNPGWYEERGIPHTLGLLLHGEPGCGKTSTIKAIANDSGRHIVNLKLSERTRKEQLKNLFFDEKLVIPGDDGNYETLIIPQSERLYVIEDIDCLTNVVFDRKYKVDNTKKEEDDVLQQFSMDPTEYKPLNTNGKLETEDKSLFIDLGFILNLLDGVLEIPSRLIVITTNYPEKLDKALIRPGRMDLVLEYGILDSETATEMISKFYGVSFDGVIELANTYTAAELTQLMCQNHGSVRGLLSVITT